MRIRKLVPLAALLLVGVAGCKDAELRADLHTWTDGPNGIHRWHEKVYNSLCELEELADLDVTKRLCPGGPGDPGGEPPDPPDWG